MEKASIIVDTPRRIRRVELQELAGNMQGLLGIRGEVTILLAPSEHIQRLNWQYRKKNKATDVLSFPPAEIAQGKLGGDLAISVDIASENARILGHSLTKELSVLIVHGMLHLAGHDHETDGGAMAKLEMKLRRRLGLPLGLIERALGPGRGPKRKRVLQHKGRN